LKTLFKQCHWSNYGAGRTSNVKYIVIHYTANDGDTAKNNADYFANNMNLRASAHYFVDEYDSVYNSVKEIDTAWHCGGGRQGIGGGKYLGTCTNVNSIGIELCSRKNNKGIYYFKEQTISNTAELTKTLMAKYGVPIDNVIRHFDVTGKDCPEPMVRDEEQWRSFKAKLINTNNNTNQEEENEMIYNYIDENMPAWARPTIQKLMNKGYLKGDDKGELGLNDTMLKIFVINDRAGLYK